MLKKIEYKITKTKRKTLCISINSSGQVTVRAPLKLNRKRIQNFVNEKEVWINKTLQKINKNQQKKALNKKLTGNRVSFLGKLYTPDKLLESSGFATLNDFLDFQQKEYFQQNILKFVPILGLNISLDQIKLKFYNYKSKWGHCRRLTKKILKGLVLVKTNHYELAFSTRLIGMPPEIIDYVIVHELAHIKHPNHSKKFWEFVAKAYPNYKQACKWLRDQ